MEYRILRDDETVPAYCEILLQQPSKEEYLKSFQERVEKDPRMSFVQALPGFQAKLDSFLATLPDTGSKEADLQRNQWDFSHSFFGKLVSECKGYKSGRNQTFRIPIEGSVIVRELSLDEIVPEGAHVLLPHPSKATIESVRSRINPEDYEDLFSRSPETASDEYDRSLQIWENADAYAGKRVGNCTSEIEGRQLIFRVIIPVQGDNYRILEANEIVSEDSEVLESWRGLDFWSVSHGYAGERVSDCNGHTFRVKK